MEFQRLRIVGFKSFVDPVEFRIEPGLTGVVGPNGCGKSNVLESLRWVMGANSAKAMRATGMDEVIFAGSSDRPARNHAEVTLTIDNAERRAPQPFTDSPLIEVSRRIDRGAGSTYRVNGKEVRARDVQLLFADASTGANSPALVRQGQISELIAAKPQNRRRILEEAGGVSGLHTRRHEAELRLRAAEANLARLDDISCELEIQLNRLKREARQAEKYKKIAAEIRALQSALLYARWADAKAALQAANEALSEADREVEDRARASTRAQTAALAAAERLKPAREEDAVAAALLHRMTLERDRLDMLDRAAREAVERLTDDIRRIGADRERETEMRDDAAAQVERLSEELTTLKAEAAAAPQRGPELQAALEAAEAGRARADAEVERLAGAVASIEARLNAEIQRRRDVTDRRARAEHAVGAARVEREAVGPMETPEITDARSALDAAVAALQSARVEVETADAARSKAQAAEGQARQAARQLEDRLNRLTAEARGLAQLLAKAHQAQAAALESTQAEKGFEAALAAALGDDLDAALDPSAAAHWAGAEAAPPAWPAGVEPLAAHIEAPGALSARLNWCGLVDRREGDRLSRGLPVGARLVSREGDLWRWDGFVSRAEAPKPAAIRMEQRNRLAELEEEIEALKPQVAEAQAALAAAADAVKAADQTLREARARPAEAERAVAAARNTHDALSRAQAQREARAQALDEQLVRLEAELAAARQAEDATPEGESGSTALDGLKTELSDARAQADEARSAAAAARLERDAEAREREGRARRLGAVEREVHGWTARAASAAQRLEQLDREEARVRAELTRAEEAPAEIATKREALVDQFAEAERRRSAAADALAEVEGLAEAADRESRASERAVGEAREARAGLAAHAEAAALRLGEADQQVREAARMAPEELGQKLKEDAVALPADAAGAESLLFGLEREREALGAVNLRAEEEAAEHSERLQSMKLERSDLTGAIGKLRDGIDELNAEGRERLLGAFETINGHFQTLFTALFGGGQAELKLVESDDPLEAGLEIFACPPGKRLSTMSLMSGGEQALTATALIFAVFLANPAPVCVLDEVDAPLDDANVDRFCRLLQEMRGRTDTRFIVITHNPVTMSRMDRLYGVTMPERGVSQLVSVDLTQATELAA
ncbi:chromosome segregation protein SMC [Brevundimonas sp.]|uniref:chromosome segregation protein SMC n=1 Tax=Brevundimonas sp. TaxID=1871086 RepID=UPI0025EA9067|nr:chromosome segregation protein SMC [Brevundimonas sp.]